MIGAVEVILILVTLLAAIAGTVSNPSPRVKGGLIALAVIASVGTGIKTYDTALQSRINERLIVTLVQSSTPPEYFAHDLVQALNPLLERTGQFVSGQSVFEDGSGRILTLARPDDPETSGVLYFSRRQMNPIYYEYAADGDMAQALAAHLERRWTDCHDHWNDCLSELSTIAKVALEVAPIHVEQTTASLAQDLTFTLTTAETFNGNPIRIMLDRAFIGSLYDLPPAKRGLQILLASQEAVIGQI